ncbi:MAG: glycosyltransferase [Bacteroidales bacterium]|nr:glycosyltransferase [Bacteroidales bacterium]
MKKRIFISIHYMEIGGAEISLMGLLDSIDYSKYDVDLFIYKHKGELMEYIPKEVNILPEEKAYANLENPIRKALINGRFRLVAARLKAKIDFKSYCRNHPDMFDDFAVHQITAKRTTPVLPSLEKYGEYDLAISFLQPHNIVLEKVKAKKKICWIHTDYTVVSVDPEMELPVWRRFDRIISISDAVTETFLKVFPSLSDKITVMQNILPQSFVDRRSLLIPQETIRKEMPVEDGVVNILSIGRYSIQKNFDNVPQICRYILDSGCRVRWYIMGWGSEEGVIRANIEKYGVASNVILLGKKQNPYPYIKACDWYVQPSRYEGAAVTVREAQMLHRPIIITNYPTAASQVKDGLDGKIVPLENKKCAEGIVAAVNDANLKNNIISYLSAHRYGNEDEIKVLEKLLEG